MENRDISSLELVLIDSTRTYVRARESGTDDKQAEGLRDTCSVMARLLGRFLETDERWNRYWWVDDVLPMSATHPELLRNPSGYELQVQGLMIWGQKGISKFWVEPCLMAVSEVAEVFQYQIHCGDAVQGLGTVPYGHQNKKAAQLLPEQWQFAFSGNRQVPE